MMTKKSSVFSHLVSILVLPFNVTVLIPALLLFYFSNSLFWGTEIPLSILIMLVGIGFLLGGLTLVALTIAQFASRGKGTLAPWDPPKKLVVSGPYRYTRNPMISGVVLILLGEVIISGSLPLSVWFVLFTSVNYSYFIIGEEPQLSKKFGEDYLEYKRNVPRLIPRRTPWTPDKKE
ncbi:isoprenylcysteine carboxylmethyltransferase family protein [Evansella sp. LMS18]|uniref:methyltransferase family protein n=1 Tax=Evansella sp. LMS18 TaxID=2924033 RepID=UPI0020D1B62D|nr:isoprenylcysteine carboxylmethyltransferase family protein [Evansella sp. LMS18]UTR10418.1 isoprenylcysteine carboxylmethyltransferase family protein [Evansella sp. LMS18]